MTGETIPAVVYVCAPTAKREAEAAAAGRAFAAAHGYRVVETITDTFGETDPANRPGWKHLLQLAGTEAVTRLVTHLPGYISTDVDRRHEATRGLADLGVRSLYSWPVQGPHAEGEETAR
ncbi:hypothetical protein [Streptomyces violaceusniger]|uniref:hypothetical protein n=1 Tax=Streptomyces violaceusniger TaxID=68280 RepID=UPI0001E4D5EC|nr:hypothetical protein [Streptomyces violaceusniger]